MCTGTRWLSRCAARDRGGTRRSETRTFATMTGRLEELADWLRCERVTRVVMEATGNYWKPVVRHEAL